MDKTLKQKFRQPFGFYMENLIGKQLLSKGIFTMYNAHHYAFEWGLDLDDDAISQLKSLLIARDVNIERLSEEVKEILKGKNGLYSETDLELVRGAFSKKENNNLFNKKIILLGVSNMISRNKLEILRFQNQKLIVSEVKSQYGPKVDYRIEFEKGQLFRLLRLTNLGMNTSLIYCIALPYPRYVEIPFIKLYDKFKDYSDFNGKEFTTDDWANLRIRIPLEYRKEEKFEGIDKSLYCFSDEQSLYKSILEEFPGKCPRLEGNI